MSTNPAYEIKDIKTKAEIVAWIDLYTISASIQEGWIVLWQHHAVFTGQIVLGKIKWLADELPVSGEKYLVRLRAFNKSKEYHFWRSGAQIKGRLRSDDLEGLVESAIDTKMVLRSVVANPLKIASTELAEAEKITVTTRNYIGYHPETQQAGYVDSRFVSFE